MGCVGRECGDGEGISEGSGGGIVHLMIFPTRGGVSPIVSTSGGYRLGLWSLGGGAFGLDSTGRYSVWCRVVETLSVGSEAKMSVFDMVFRHSVVGGYNQVK